LVCRTWSWLGKQSNCGGEATRKFEESSEYPHGPSPLEAFPLHFLVPIICSNWPQNFHSVPIFFILSFSSLLSYFVTVLSFIYWSTSSVTWQQVHIHGPNWRGTNRCPKQVLLRHWTKYMN
jgi:hypothetical protein